METALYDWLYIEAVTMLATPTRGFEDWRLVIFPHGIPIANSFGRRLDLEGRVFHRSGISLLQFRN